MKEQKGDTMKDICRNIFLIICEMQDEFAFSEWRLSQKVSLSLRNINPSAMVDHPYIETYFAVAMLPWGDESPVGCTLFRLSPPHIHHRQ